MFATKIFSFSLSSIVLGLKSKDLLLSKMSIIALFIILLFNSMGVEGGYPSSSYGGYGGGYETPKYPYLPAPPGETPTCAKHGATYCEKVDTYPTEVISYLLYKWGRTYQQFIRSEKDQDFMRILTQKYGPTSEISGGYGSSNSNNDQPSSSYLPQGYGNNNQPSQGYGGNTANESNPNLVASYYRNGNNNRPQREHQEGGYGYTFSIPPKGQQGLGSENHSMAAAIPPIVHSIWWNHRDARNNQESFPHVNQYNQHQRWKRRVKRQSSENQLCPTVSNFISPMAAMTNDGNWMYVVNMESTQYVQRVKSEICAQGDGSTCNGLCSIPPGFRATCRQKFVQKSLVALDGSGDSLRSDVFWFPHCCLCEVTN